MKTGKPDLDRVGVGVGVGVRLRLRVRARARVRVRVRIRVRVRVRVGLGLDGEARLVVELVLEVIDVYARDLDLLAWGEGEG